MILRLAGLLIGSLIFRDMEVTIIIFAATSFVYWVSVSLYSLRLGGVKISRSVILIVSVTILSVVPLGLIKIFLI
jgi:hypothetical protein